MYLYSVVFVDEAMNGVSRCRAVVVNMYQHVKFRGCAVTYWRVADFFFDAVGRCGATRRR